MSWDSGKWHRKRKQAAASVPLIEEIIRGSLFRRRRRCGQPRCHCANEKGHASYYLAVNRVGKSPLQISLPTTIVPQVREWTQNYTRLWKVIEDVSAMNREWIRRERKLQKGSRKRDYD